jgi:protein TonB
MLAYAANRPVVGQRRSSPHALLGIVAGHVAVVALVMSIRMDLPEKIRDTPLVVDLIRANDPPPPPVVPDPQPQAPAQRPSTLAPPQPQVPMPMPAPAPDFSVQPAPGPRFDQVIGPDIQPLPPRAEPRPTLVPDPVRTSARLLTGAADLRPPYPETKLASGEEAVLRLKLTIDATGRVIAVESLGPSDRAFVAAARRHLMARWRYRAASEDGRAIVSTTVVSLRFQLDS